jgi:hypothetical protein
MSCAPRGATVRLVRAADGTDGFDQNEPPVRRTGGSTEPRGTVYFSQLGIPELRLVAGLIGPELVASVV